MLTWWLVAAAVSDDAFAVVQWFLATPVGLLLLFGWSLALFFHFFSGIRHLAGTPATASTSPGTTGPAGLW